MKFKPYPVYKDSGVEWLGRVPEHWRVERGMSAFTESRRVNYDLQSNEYLSLVAGRGVLPYAEKGNIGNKKPDDLSKCKLVDAGDYVINSMNFMIGSYGVSPYDGVCSPVYVVLKNKEDVLKIGYGDLIFSDPSYQQYTQSFGTGILDHRRAIGWDEIKQIPIPLPPLQEQCAISFFVHAETTRIDVLIAKKARFIELLREKRQALITHAVTKGLDADAPMKDSGVEWLGEVPRAWAVAKLNYRFDIQLGKMLDEKKIVGTNAVRYLRNKDVQWSGINAEDLPTMDIKPQELERYTVIRGDLLVCEGGEVGRAAIWMGERIGYQKALHRVRSRSGDEPEFLRYVLMAASASGAFEEQDTKSTISHLPAEKFRTYKFPFPPSVEQRAITIYLDRATARIDTLIAKTERSIELLRERRTALISAAVTGKIDLREAA